MKFVILLYFIPLLPFHAAAQGAVDKTVVTLSAKEQPAYPGGEKELRKYLLLNLRYPNEALEHQVEGELQVSFIIAEDGAVSDISVKKGLGYGCDEEAIRVVGKMPLWQPARVGGKPVKVTYLLPIQFELPVTAAAGKD